MKYRIADGFYKIVDGILFVWNGKGISIVYSYFMILAKDLDKTNVEF